MNLNSGFIWRFTDKGRVTYPAITGSWGHAVHMDSTFGVNMFQACKSVSLLKAPYPEAQQEPGLITLAFPVQNADATELCGKELGGWSENTSGQ